MTAKKEKIEGLIFKLIADANTYASKRGFHSVNVPRIVWKSNKVKHSIAHANLYEITMYESALIKYGVNTFVDCIVPHEIGHVIDFSWNGKSGHCKTWKEICSRVLHMPMSKIGRYVVVS